MKIGIRAHDVGKHDPQTLAAMISDYGFEYIQLVFKKAIDSAIDLEKDQDILQAVEFALHEKNLKVAMLGAYFNPVHSNQEKVQESIEYFRKHLKLCKLFNTTYVGTETGSFNDDKWTFHEKNASDEGYQQVKKVFKELLITAENNEAYLAIEPAAHHVISTPKKLEKLINELDNPYVVVTFDLYNLLTIHNYTEQEAIIDLMVGIFKDKIKLVHLKDFIRVDDQLIQVGLGQGIINFNYLFSKLNTLNEEPIYIFEGITEEDIEKSINFIHTFDV